MEIKKAYKFRMEPNQEQKEILEKHFGCTRFVYNYFLRQRTDHFTETGKGLSYFKNSKALTQLKRETNFIWLNEVNSQSLQHSLRDLDIAYNNFFNKQAKYPNFKKKRNQQSFRVPQYFNIEGNCLNIPKIKGLTIRFHQTIQGEVHNITISKTPTEKYYASFQVITTIPEPKYTGKSIGVDFGLQNFITDSNSNKIKHPKHLRKSLKLLKRAHQKLSRTQRGSSNRKKAIRYLAARYEKVTHRRNDFLHKLSRKMVDENQAIHIEDLSIKNMIKNHSFAQALSDSGWSEFVRQLEYKGTWYGCDIITVDRWFPSSRRCHQCGWINETLTLKDRKWTCICGILHDRDINAAKNILTFSTAGTAES